MRNVLLLFLAAVAVPGCASSPLGCSGPAVPTAETRPSPPPARQPAAAPIGRYHSISPAEAKNRLAGEEGIVLLDVRTPAEHEARRIPGSVLLPVEPVNLVGSGIQAVVPDRNTPIFVYCRSGRRSVDAAEILVKAGYANVYDLGGINSWPYETIGADARR